MKTNIRKIYLSYFTYRIFRYQYKDGDILVCSFPKCGRTWVKFFISNYLIQVLGIQKELNLKNINHICPNYSFEFPSGPLNFSDPSSITASVEFHNTHKVPRIIFTHQQFNQSFPKYKIVLLVRDIRDVMVSKYYHNINRLNFKGSFSESLKKELPNSIAWLNSWGENKSKVNSLLIIRYEDLLVDPDKYFKKIIQFIGLPIKKEILQNSIKAASFSSMKKIEENKGGFSKNVVSGNRSDNSFHVRKGKPGDYKNYISKKDNLIFKKMMNKLKDNFGYYYF